MNIKILNTKTDPAILGLCLEFLMGLIAEEFFPNPRIAKRILFKNPAGPDINTYFNALLSENVSFALLSGKKVLMLGVLKPMKFESSIFKKKMYSLKIYEDRVIKPGLQDKLKFMRKIMDFSPKNGIEHISCKLDTQKYSTVHALEKTGFFLVSTLITYLHIRNSSKLPLWRTRYKVREAHPEDKKIVADITKDAFSQTRFYNDPCLDANKCSTLYEQWAANCFEKNWASNIFVAESSKKNVVGYLTYLIDQNLKNIFGIIKGGGGISACLPDSKGAYPSLLAHSILDVPKYDASYCEYTTQAENSEVIRMWHKFGLDYGKTELVFHKGLS